MQMNLIEKARANRFAAVTALSAKRSIERKRPLYAISDTVIRPDVWQKEIPVFRSLWGSAQGYAQVA